MPVAGRYAECSTVPMLLIAERRISRTLRSTEICAIMNAGTMKLGKTLSGHTSSSALVTPSRRDPTRWCAKHSVAPET